jgi:hypothetical protein
MRAPGYSLDCRLVLSELADRVDRRVCRPDEEFVVVTPGSKQLRVRRPLEAADLLLMAALLP